MTKNFKEDIHGDNLNFAKMVDDFHKVFSYATHQKPTPLTWEELEVRNKFVMEELVEGVFATALHDKEMFLSGVETMKKMLDEVAQDTLKKESEAVLSKETPSEDEVLIGQVDGWVDALYFLFGNFSIIGVDPNPIFKIVHNANMGKLDPETGKPIIRESDGKILKQKNWERDYKPEPLIEKEIERQKRQ